MSVLPGRGRRSRSTRSIEAGTDVPEALEPGSSGGVISRADGQAPLTPVSGSLPPWRRLWDYAERP